jgi:hypothetical protein
MKKTSGIFWGLLLMGGGVLLLLQSLGYLDNISPYFWTLAFGVAGLSFGVGFLLDRSRWWALIPGAILLGLAATIFLSATQRERLGEWIGAVFLGGVALAFWLVYLVRRDMWWPIIPAGVMTTVALVAGLGESAGGVNSGAILFLGLAVTFSLVWLAIRRLWPLIIALALLSMGLLLGVGLGGYAKFFWPAVLILGGLYLLTRAFRPARQ